MLFIRADRSNDLATFRLPKMLQQCVKVRASSVLASILRLRHGLGTGLVKLFGRKLQKLLYGVSTMTVLSMFFARQEVSRVANSKTRVVF